MAADNKLNIDLIINDKEALAKLRASLGEVEKTAKSGSEGITKGMVSAAAATAAAVVVFDQLVKVMGEAIAASAEQEEAVNRLNNALRLQGTFSQKVSQEYQDMATEMARSSRFADEAINQVQQRLAAIGGVLPQQMRAATQATLDLAAVLGIDLSQAANLMAKAAQGETAMLERQLPVLKGVINEHMDFAQVLKLVQQQIGGSAQADLNSFAAKQENLSKAWGEVLEEMGNFITKSPTVRKAMDDMAEGMNQMADSMRKFREENPDFLGDMLKKLNEALPALMTGGPLAGGGFLLGKSLAEKIIGGPEEAQKAITTLEEVLAQADAVKQAQLTKDDMDEIQRRQKFIQGEVEKIDQLRVIWDEWNNEKTSKAMAQIQAETDFLNLAIQTQQLAHESMWKSVGKMKDTFSAGIADMFKQSIRGTLDLGEAFKQLGLKMVDILIDYGVQLAVNMALSKAFSAAQVGVSAATGAAVAAAWAPAAAAASLATLGGNATAAAAALTSTHALSRALSAVPGLAEGGTVISGGATLVGERGPELLNLPQGARVTPLEKAGGGDVTIHINFNGPIQASEDNAREFAQKVASYVSEFIDTERERL